MLLAARELFVSSGYSATTIAEIAERARVSPDTIYATVGRKPALLRELDETAISGTEQAVPNMRRFAGDLRGTGELRGDLTDDQVADIVWSMNAAEYWDLLVRERGWTPDQFAEWLTDAWTRLLLQTP